MGSKQLDAPQADGTERGGEDEAERIQRHSQEKKPGFVRFGSTAAFVTPVSEQAGLTHEKREAYEMAMQLLQSIDPQYAAGETLVQFALMESHEQYVKLHRDDHDISFQYALSLGDYQGA